MSTSLIDFHQFWASIITPERIALYIKVALILFIGIPLVGFLKRLTGRLIKDKLSLQSEMLIKRFVYYIGIMLIFISVLNELGFKLSALMGAAGVLGIAIGFASQTSFSNIISGLFLISEKPFMIGDIIQIGDTIGNVISIDLLSVKVRTFDYRFVRVPNENMIKAEIVNLTRFDTRRVNVNISVAYKDDLKKVIAVLKDVAATEPMAMKEPEPVIVIDKFGNSGIDIMFGVWGNTENFVELKNALYLKVKERFEAEGIEIPFPHVKVANSVVSRIPVEVEIRSKTEV